MAGSASQFLLPYDALVSGVLMTRRWFLSHAEGDPYTSGSFREAQYRYAIQPEAQDPNNASACFRLPAWDAPSRPQS